MTNQALKNFAEELKSLREEKQISLQQIATRTRIDIKFLRAIEDGNFEVLPEIYVRAFIKEYCNVVEISPLEFLNKFELAKQGKAAGDAEPESQGEKSSVDSQEPKTEFDASAELKTAEPKTNDIKLKLNKVQLYSIAASAAVVLLIAVYFFFLKSSSPDIITEKSYDEIMGSSQDRYELPQDSVSQSYPAPGDSLSLKIEATDTVWLKSLMDKTVEREFLLKPNARIEIRAKSDFDLVIGNAGGLKLNLNNRQIDSVGKRGEVKRILLSAGGMKYMPITLPPKDEQKIRSAN